MKMMQELTLFWRASDLNRRRKCVCSIRLEAAKMELNVNLLMNMKKLMNQDKPQL
jgi:hypothetical protein